MAILSASNNFLFKTGFSIKEEQVLEFCESDLDLDLFAASTSNCCYEDDLSSYTTNYNLSFPPPDHIIKYNNNFSIIFDEEITKEENEITTSSYQIFNNQDQFDLTLLPVPLTTNHHVIIEPAASIIVPTDTVCEDDTMPMPMPPSLNCSFMEPSLPPPLQVDETCGIFSTDLFLGDNNGIFCQDPLPRPYNSNQLQALSSESQQQRPVNGNGNGNGGGTPLSSEITSMEAETSSRVIKKLTTEERKEKIHRYLKKRNQRNFSKKIKYVCRKTLADSRPRVRGRFAKNDEFGDNNRCNYSHDVKPFHVVVKEDDENFESSDIFAHINGLNSFKCNYPIQSWI